MLVLGLDPGLAVTGYGFVEGDGQRLVSVAHGVIRTRAKTPTADRLMKLHDELSRILAQHHPNAIAIEELFFGKNARTAMTVGEARGVLLLSLAEYRAQVAECLHIAEYTPLQVKKAITGYGRAGKAQVREMVRVLLSMPEIPRPYDAADALAVSICHHHSARMMSLRQV